MEKLEDHEWKDGGIKQNNENDSKMEEDTWLYIDRLNPHQKSLIEKYWVDHDTLLRCLNDIPGKYVNIKPNPILYHFFKYELPDFPQNVSHPSAYPSFAILPILINQTRLPNYYLYYHFKYKCPNDPVIWLQYKEGDTEISFLNRLCKSLGVDYLMTKEMKDPLYDTLNWLVTTLQYTADTIQTRPSTLINYLTKWTDRHPPAPFASPIKIILNIELDDYRNEKRVQLMDTMHWLHLLNRFSRELMNSEIAQVYIVTNSDAFPLYWRHLGQYVKDKDSWKEIDQVAIYSLSKSICGTREKSIPWMQKFDLLPIFMNYYQDKLLWYDQHFDDLNESEVLSLIMANEQSKLNNPLLAKKEINDWLGHYFPHIPKSTGACKRTFLDHETHLVETFVQRLLTENVSDSQLGSNGDMRILPPIPSSSSSRVTSSHESAYNLSYPTSDQSHINLDSKSPTLLGDDAKKHQHGALESSWLPSWVPFISEKRKALCDDTISSSSPLYPPLTTSNLVDNLSDPLEANSNLCQRALIGLVKAGLVNVSINPTMNDYQLLWAVDIEKLLLYIVKDT